MASDVFFAGQICYLNDINRYHEVCFGLLNAKKVFERTFQFQYRPQLQQEAERVRLALAAGKQISDPSFPRYPYRIASLDERLIVKCYDMTIFRITRERDEMD